MKGNEKVISYYPNGIVELKDKFSSLAKMKYFDELYTLILMLIALIGWSVNSIVSIYILFISGIIVLLLTNDISYLIPNTIYSIYTINKDFRVKDISIGLMIIGGIYILFLVLQIILNGIHLKRMKSYIGLFGLAIANIIPIFYASIPNGKNIFYLFFFIDLIYFSIYLIFVNGIKRDSLKMIAHTMCWLGVLLAFECIISVIELAPTVDNILSLRYNLGWADSDAAGVMICMAIPFAYYIIGKEGSGKMIIFNHLKVLLMCAGIILASLKGAFIFGMLEAFVLLIALFFYSENKKAYRYNTGFYIAIMVSIFMILSVPTYLLIRNISTYIFTASATTSDKLEIWRIGIASWTENPLTILFGSGFASVIEEGDGVSRPLVYHSAFIETLVVGGILAIIFLLIHYFEKYRAIKLIDNKLFKITMLTGLIGVDLYSAIDNTYHMYYCMIPFVITIAAIDTTIYLNKVKREEALMNANLN